MSLTTLLLVGCSGKGGDEPPAGSWDVRAEDSREVWLWLDSDFPEDDVQFTVTVSPTAIPATAFVGGVEVALTFETSSEEDDTAPTVPDVDVELVLDGEVVASASAAGDSGVTLLDESGPLTCVEGAACTLGYTVRASMDGGLVIVTADALLSAWIVGSGTPPEDAKVSITDF